MAFVNNGFHNTFDGEIAEKGSRNHMPTSNHDAIIKNKEKRISKLSSMVKLMIFLLLVASIALVVVVVLYVDEKDKNENINDSSNNKGQSSGKETTTRPTTTTNSTTTTTPETTTLLTTTTSTTPTTTPETTTRPTTTTNSTTTTTPETTTRPTTTTNSTTTTTPETTTLLTTTTSSTTTTTPETTTLLTTTTSTTPTTTPETTTLPTTATNCSTTPTTTPVNPAVCTTMDCVNSAARIHASLDTSVDPCQDFYQYSCGSWLKDHIIPEDDSSVFVFTLLANKVKIMLKTLLEEERSSRDPSFINEAKIFYESCMDTSFIDWYGYSPLKSMLDDEFGGWPILLPVWNDTTFDLTEVAKKVFAFRNNALFTFGAWTDIKNSSFRVLSIDQVTLTLPAIDYYLLSRSDSILIGYQKIIYDTAMLMGANESIAAEDAEDIVDFEIELAKISVPAWQRRDIDLLYNPVSLRFIHEKYKEVFDWMSFVQGMMGIDGVEVNITDMETIINYSPTYFEQLTAVMKRTPKRVVANYMLWRVAYSYRYWLADSSTKIAQVFDSILLGTNASPPRYATCADLVSNFMAEATGHAFIKDQFNPAAKAENKYIKQSIGYQSTTTNVTYIESLYKDLKYTTYDFFNNVRLSREDRLRKNLRSLREPIDPYQWGWPPHTVNAFYKMTQNLIVFPAGILQSPFFSFSYPKSMNYGAIGMVIGHEITHGFDDEGRRYNKNGQLVQWWSDDAIAKFETQAKCIVDQYDNFHVTQVGLNISGKLTEGENIADNGGIRQSFKAYRNWVADNGEEEMPLPGLNLTHNQLFFISFAQIWCQKYTDASLRNRIYTSVHSPGEFRVIGALQNSDDFSEAFQCKAGTPMSRKNKCRVW